VHATANGPPGFNPCHLKELHPRRNFHVEYLRM